jgi:hypothetical protein
MRCDHKPAGPGPQRSLGHSGTPGKNRNSALLINQSIGVAYNPA